tara:strand:+ start:331 stop:468 length:138 start_codon:yes stop_codon:yes gene_type:complete
VGLEVEGEGDEERDRECEERDLRSLVEEEEEEPDLLLREGDSLLR